MSRFFSVGPFPLGVVARFGAAFVALILGALAFFAVVFLDLAFAVISRRVRRPPGYAASDIPFPEQSR